MKQTFLILVSLLFSCFLHAAVAQDFAFSWDRATVYYVMTDRFENSDSSNDMAYGRGLDGSGTAYDFDEAGFFHGGDFVGLTSVVESDYFNDLGVDVLLITAPYEQIHGWVGGGDGDFQSFAYHGYWPLDFTSVDAAFGTESDFGGLIDAAHSNGLRVVLDVGLDHAGYATPQDMSDLGFGGLTSDAWRDWRPREGESWRSFDDRFVTHVDSADAWSRWWGSSWIRADLPGYDGCEDDDESGCQDLLPDFRSDSEVHGIPAFLASKWGEERTRDEQRTLDEFFERTGYERSPANHIIKWLTDWVRRYGIDGFRVGSALDIGSEVFTRLKAEAVRALSTWKAENPTKALDELDFWMAGEARGQGPTLPEYVDSGFDSIINTDFQDKAGNPLNLDSTYGAYSQRLNSDPSLHFISYISSHDTRLFDREDLINAATSLLLLPGGVQIFYGDETGRPAGRAVSDPIQAMRSAMNWESINPVVYEHWKKLGQFRRNHPSIAAGSHEQLAEKPYTFYRGIRIGTNIDQVIIVLGATERVRLYVTRIFPDDTILRDAYTGKISIVSFGEITFEPHESGVLLIEEVK